MGCGGPTLEGGVYRGNEVQYRVGQIGAGFQSVSVADHNDLAWSNHETGALVQVNSTCEADMDVPLTALTNHLLIGFTEREIRSQETHPLDGREALVTNVVAKLDGVLRTMLLVVLKKDGCVYDMSLIAPDEASFASARPSFEQFVGEFHTVGTTP